MADKAIFVNNGTTTLNTGISAVATALVAVDGSVLPNPSAGQFAWLTLDNGTNIEIVKLTARSGNNLTVTRAQQGTSGFAFLAGATIENRWTKSDGDVAAIVDYSDAAVAIAGLTPAADRLPYFTGAAAAALTTFTSAARSLLDDATVADMRDTLGLTKYAVLASDATENANTYTDAAGLAFTPAANATYIVEAFLAFASDTVTTGFQWYFRGPTGLDHSAMYCLSPITATSMVQRFGDLGSTFGAAGTAVAVANAVYPAYGFAILRTGATPSGDVKVQFRSEVAASTVTLKRGSSIRYRRIE